MSSTAEQYSTGGTLVDEGEVRLAFEDAVANDGRSLPVIAAETAFSYATIHAWRNGKYAGDNKKVTEAIRQWVVTREAKKRTIDTMPGVPDFVMTPTASRIIEVLERTRVLIDIGVIAGGPGIGKTTSFRWYKRETPNVWLVTMQPCMNTVRGMMEAIAGELGVQVHSRNVDMADRIRRKLANTAGLLIVDEAQNLPPQALDQLRAFHDLAEIGIALGGNETVFSQFGADRRTPHFAQLFSRVGQRFTRRDLVKGDLDALIDAWKLKDDDARAAIRLIGRQPGAARGMTKALRMAFVLARADGREQPEKADIDAAWRHLGGTP